MSAEPFYPYRLSSRGQFSLPVSEAVRACASPVCLCVFVWLLAKSLEMTTSPLNRGTVKLREVRPPLRCEWVQKALNTTELPRAHIDFLAEARVLGQGNWKRQQGQAGGLDLRNCPSPTTAPTAQIYHRCGRMWWRWWGTPITLQPKGAGLCHWAAPTERRFCQSVGRSNECLPYLWIPEKSNMCGALTESQRALSSLSACLTNSLHERIFSWLLYLPCLEHDEDVIVICCVFRNEIQIHVTWIFGGFVRCREKIFWLWRIISAQTRNIKCSFSLFFWGGLPKSLYNSRATDAHQVPSLRACSCCRPFCCFHLTYNIKAIKTMLYLLYLKLS